MPNHLPRKLQNQEIEWHYHLKFDPCTNLKDTWVPGPMLDLLNKFRDTIFVNSSKFDAIQLQN